MGPRGRLNTTILLLLVLASVGCSKVFVNLSMGGSQNQWPYYQCQNQVFVLGQSMSYSPSYVPPGSTFSVMAGNFPPGISINPSTGVISGTATAITGQQMVNLSIVPPSGMPYFVTIQSLAEHGTIVSGGGSLTTAIGGIVAGGYAVVMGPGLYTLTPAVKTSLLYPVDFYGDCQGNGTSVIDGTTSWGFNPASGINLSFNNLTLQNFTSASGSGAVWISNDLGNSHWSFNNDIFTNNSTSTVNEGGAAIDFYQGGTSGSSSIGVNNCVFANNSMTGSGGGGGAIFISTSSGMTMSLGIQQSVFMGNSDTGAGGSGGAIYINGAGGGTLNGNNPGPPNSFVSQSTFSGSYATQGGAIYYSASASSNAVIVNSTFNQNGSATTVGAAIYSAAIPGTTFSLWNDTFSGNTSMSGGGAVYQVGSTPVMHLLNNIFAHNASGGVLSISCGGTYMTYSTDGYNLFDDTNPSCTNVMTSEYGSANLGPLQWNGGNQNLQTMAPGYGSIAIDRIPISSGQCPPWDEVNNPRGTDGYCDAGAFETGNYNF